MGSVKKESRDWYKRRNAVWQGIKTKLLDNLELVKKTGVNVSYLLTPIDGKYYSLIITVSGDRLNKGFNFSGSCMFTNISKYECDLLVKEVSEISIKMSHNIIGADYAI